MSAAENVVPDVMHAENDLRSVQIQSMAPLAPSIAAPPRPIVHDHTARPMSLFTSNLTPTAPFNDPTPAPRGRLLRFDLEASELPPRHDRVHGSAMPPPDGRAGQAREDGRRGSNAQVGYMAQGGQGLDFLRHGPATPSGMGGQLGFQGQNTLNSRFETGRRIQFDYDQPHDGSEQILHALRSQGPTQAQQVNVPTFVPLDTNAATASGTADGQSDAVVGSPSRRQRDIDSPPREDESE